MKTFGEKIKEIRTVFGLSQARIAELTGISRSAIGKYECDKMEMTPHTITRFVKAFEDKSLTEMIFTDSNNDLFDEWLEAVFNLYSEEGIYLTITEQVSTDDSFTIKDLKNLLEKHDVKKTSFKVLKRILTLAHGDYNLYTDFIAEEYPLDVLCVKTSNGNIYKVIQAFHMFEETLYITETKSYIDYSDEDNLSLKIISYMEKQIRSIICSSEMLKLIPDFIENEEGGYRDKYPILSSIRDNAKADSSCLFICSHNDKCEHEDMYIYDNEYYIDIFDKCYKVGMVYIICDMYIYQLSYHCLLSEKDIHLPKNVLKDDPRFKTFYDGLPKSSELLKDIDDEEKFLKAIEPYKDKVILSEFDNTIIIKSEDLPEELSKRFNKGMIIQDKSIYSIIEEINTGVMSFYVVDNIGYADIRLAKLLSECEYIKRHIDTDISQNIKVLYNHNSMSYLSDKIYTQLDQKYINIDYATYKVINNIIVGLGGNDMLIVEYPSIGVTTSEEPLNTSNNTILREELPYIERGEDISSIYEISPKRIGSEEVSENFPMSKRISDIADKFINVDKVYDRNVSVFDEYLHVYKDVFKNILNIPFVNMTSFAFTKKHVKLTLKLSFKKDRNLDEVNLLRDLLVDTKLINKNIKMGVHLYKNKCHYFTIKIPKFDKDVEDIFREVGHIYINITNKHLLISNVHKWHRTKDPTINKSELRAPANPTFISKGDICTPTPLMLNIKKKEIKKFTYSIKESHNALSTQIILDDAFIKLYSRIIIYKDIPFLYIAKNEFNDELTVSVKYNNQSVDIVYHICD